jgi:hypothetical protein
MQPALVTQHLYLCELQQKLDTLAYLVKTQLLDQDLWMFL